MTVSEWKRAWGDAANPKQVSPDGVGSVSVNQ